MTVTRNRLLNVMLFISTSFCILLLLTQLFVTVIFVHWHIDRDFYSQFSFTILDWNAFFKITHTETSVIGKAIGHVPTILSNISRLSFYFLFLQLSAITLLTLAAVREFITVIRSVKQIRTFVSSNIESFRKIGFRLLLVFIFSGFHVMTFGNTALFGIYLHVTPLIMAVLSYTLSEIFKEGNALLEDNKGTI